MSAALLAYLSLGACAGLLSGLFGIGGGIILVPFLAWLFAVQGQPAGIVMLLAIATSLSTIVLTSLSSVFAHSRRGAVDWRIVFRLAPGILLGSITGSVIAEWLPGAVLKVIFAGYLLIVALQMGLRLLPRSGQVHLSAGQLLSAGGVIGMVSAILGIGGGTLTVPFLTKAGVPIHHAVGISAACGLPIAIAGTFTYGVLGWQHSPLPDGYLGYIYLPAFVGIVAGSIPLAPVGARLAHHLPTDRLKRFFAFFLLIVAIKLLWND